MKRKSLELFAPGSKHFNSLYLLTTLSPSDMATVCVKKEKQRLKFIMIWQEEITYMLTSCFAHAKFCWTKAEL